MEGDMERTIGQDHISKDHIDKKEESNAQKHIQRHTYITRKQAVIMAGAIISIVGERLKAFMDEQTGDRVSLVTGVEKEVRSLASGLNIIRCVLVDAENRRFKEESIKDWLKRLEYTSYEMEDVLDEWNYAILKHRMEHESNDAVPPNNKVRKITSSLFSSVKEVVVRHDIAEKIKNVKEQLDELLKEKEQYNFVVSQPPPESSAASWRVQSTSLIDLAEVHGRDRDRGNIVRKLMLNCDSRVVSIVGVGGLGKTTLAQLVYNDSQVKDCFELRIWVCVSDPFDEVEIAKRIVESVRKERSQDTNNLEMLLQSVTESVSGKKFLLVLDDVWTQDYTKWEPLKNCLINCGGVGSKILVTTRNKGVAKMMGTIENEIYCPQQLSNEDCWLVLRHMALLGRNEEQFKFQDIGKKIANKCKGLPLAAKVLGSLLRGLDNLEQWESILNSEIWQLETAEVDLFPHLLLSYNELSPALKLCFSYCAIFPKDSEIEVEKLIGNWMALGYLGSNIGGDGDMELKGQMYFQNLAMRSLFQDFVKSDLDGQIIRCKMHDIVHDFAQFLRKNGRVEATGMKKTTCQVGTPLLVSSVKEYRSLFCIYNESPSNLNFDYLTSLRVLEARWPFKLHSIQDLENLIHLRWLDLSRHHLSGADLKTICKLYNLQTLLLRCCELQEIPREIGNLIHLRHLNLSCNDDLKELPEDICGLHELRTLNVDGCYILRGFPKGLAQLTGLRTLTVFRGGSGRSKLGWLKNLDRLSGSLRLFVNLADDDLEDVVEDAWKAELWNKSNIQKLWIIFNQRMHVKSMDVIDALKPHPNLLCLEIFYCIGPKYPGWITSLNQLRHIKLNTFGFGPLPPLGKLPCLEEIGIFGMHSPESVGREFLGITTTIGTGDADIQSSSSSSSASVAAAATNTIVFPKLKKLTFSHCWKWKEWEDITAKEEESTALALMPCLTELSIKECSNLNTLPHRLLRKTSLLEVLDISRSTQLERRYGNKGGPDWKSISQNNPCLQLKLR